VPALPEAAEALQPEVDEALVDGHDLDAGEGEQLGELVGAAVALGDDARFEEGARRDAPAG
jgi:hypothetical protein